MTSAIDNEEVVWTPLMQDRRKNDRRNNVRDFQANGRSLNITEYATGMERRRGNDRRQEITLTITGRAIDVGSDSDD